MTYDNVTDWLEEDFLGSGYLFLDGYIGQLLGADAVQQASSALNLGVYLSKSALPVCCSGCSCSGHTNARSFNILSQTLCARGSLQERCSHDILHHWIFRLPLLNNCHCHHSALHWRGTDRVRLSGVYEARGQLHANALPLFHGWLPVRFRFSRAVLRSFAETLRLG